jgi:muramoyltetrapeptide carboxypeptidase
MLTCSLRPPRVRPGDQLAIVAPSGPVGKVPLEEGIQRLSERYRLALMPELLGPEHGFLSAPDDRRLAGLLTALAEEAHAGIILGRGGYGLLRIVDRLRPGWLAAHPKPIIGFSDGTVLLAAAAREGVPSIHGPVVTQLGRLEEKDRAALYALLENPDPTPLLDGLEPVVPGQAQGPLLGGNLEVFSRLLGSPYLPDMRGAILFLEEVGERPYRIDRLLTHLELAGIFRAVSGVVLGDFVECEETTRRPYPKLTEVLRERLSRLAIPVALGAPVGHAARHRALPHGVRVRLDTVRGTLTALEGVVS